MPCRRGTRRPGRGGARERRSWPARRTSRGGARVRERPAGEQGGEEGRGRGQRAPQVVQHLQRPIEGTPRPKIQGRSASRPEPTGVCRAAAAGLLRGELLEERDVAGQTGPREDPFEEVVRQERVLGHASRQRGLNVSTRRSPSRCTSPPGRGPGRRRRRGRVRIDPLGPEKILWKGVPLPSVGIVGSPGAGDGVSLTTVAFGHRRPGDGDGGPSCPRAGRRPARRPGVGVQCDHVAHARRRLESSSSRTKVVSAAPRRRRFSSWSFPRFRSHPIHLP